MPALPLRQRGLTMIELVLFIVIVSVGLVGILQVLNVSNRHSADPLPRKQALAIAEALLEEVQLARFTYCDPADANAETASSTADCANPALVERVGPEQNNARPFDNVNDYVTAFGVAQAAFNNGAGRLADVTLADLPVDGAYTATLTITPEALNGINSTAGSGTPAETTAVNVLRITVTVNYGNESITLDGYRTRYAPNALP